MQLSSENGAFLYIYIGSSKEINFFQKIHSLNLRKEENLNSDIILFEDDSGLTNKISLFDLTACFQSGRGEVGIFILSIHCMKKKSELIIFFLMIACVRERLYER